MSNASAKPVLIPDVKAPASAHLEVPTPDQGVIPETLRTLIRVVSVQGSKIGIVVPGRDTEQRIEISRSIFPEALRNDISIGSRYFAFADLDADSQEDLAKSITVVEGVPPAMLRRPAAL